MYNSNQKNVFLKIAFWGLLSVGYVPVFANENYCALNKITINIIDETGNYTAARIRVTGKNSSYYAPEGHLVDFPITEREGDLGQGGDVILDNDRRFAYIDGTCRIDLPEKEVVRIEVVKGYTYRFIDTVITISPGTEMINIQLEKWFQFPNGETWYSGDIHTHEINSATALLSMKAEDVNVCNILISDFTTDQKSFRGAPEPISDSLHIVYLNQEYREDRLGHIDLLNLKKLIEPVAKMRPYQYPLNIKAMDQVHEQGGHVSWAHFAAYPALEGPLAIILKKVDAVELLCTIDPFSEPVFVSDIVPDLRMNSGLRLWYRLLNCGLKIPATAGTDKMNNWVTVGGNRVYALVKGKFNYQKWIEALNTGQSFVTNSPMLFCKVNGKYPGEQIDLTQRKPVKIVAEVSSQLPIDRLEIVANGEVIAEKIIGKGQNHARLEIEYTPQQSVWIAARAHQYNQEDVKKGLSIEQRRDVGGGPTLFNKYYGTLRPEVPFAHTNPCFVIINKRPIHSLNDALYFVRYLQNSMQWLQEYGKFPSSEAKKEVLNSFEEGIELYKKLAK